MVQAGLSRTKWRLRRAVPWSVTRACLHSSGPENGGDDVDHRSEAFVRLFVARCDAPKRFNAAEKVFDEMTPLVFLAIMLGVPGRSLAQRNDGLNVAATQYFAQPMGVERLIADQGQAIDAGHESVKAGDVVALAWQKHEADQITKRIDEHRNLRRQAAARPADGLILRPPFAPVPC